MDSTTDTSLVELAKAGDEQAFGELYNRYFEAVYDFAARLARSRDEAEDIAQDTFLKAMNALGGLQKGASFRSWVFTIARNTALSRIARAGRTRPFSFMDDDGEEVSFDVADPDRFANPAEAAEANAVAALVWQAAVGLDPKQLSLLDLHLRQGLDSGEIADVLGVTRNNGSVMLNRLKKAVGDSIGAFVMLNGGRQYCRQLDRALASASIAGMSPEARKVVDRHVAQCPECEERRRKLAPLAAFGAFVAVGAPAGAKARVLEGLSQQWPGPATASAGGGGPGAGGNAPSMPGEFFGGAKNFFRVGAGLGMAAAVLAVLLLVPASPLALTRQDPPKTTLAADPGGSPSPNPSITTPGATPTPAQAASRTPSPVPATAATAVTTVPQGATVPASTPSPLGGTATPTPAATATPTSIPPSATPTVVPTATPTAQPCSPALGTFISGLAIPPGSTQVFALNNLSFCGSASFAVSGDAAWLNVSPATGSIGPGQSATITVGVDTTQVPLGEGTYTGALTINGPNGQSFALPVATTRGGQSPLVSLITDRCSRGSLTLFVRVSAGDDLGVSNVVVNYTLTTGVTGQQPLALVSGTITGGAWEAQFTAAGSSPAGIASYSVVATDGAGHPGSFSKTCG